MGFIICYIGLFGEIPIAVNGQLTHGDWTNNGYLTKDNIKLNCKINSHQNHARISPVPRLNHASSTQVSQFRTNITPVSGQLIAIRILRHYHARSTPNGLISP